MKHLFKPERLKGFIVLVSLLLVVKLLWFIVGVVWLPVSGVNHTKEVATKALYYRVKLTPNEIDVPVKRAVREVRKPQGSIKSVKLLALYNAFDTTVVTVLYKKKTKVLSRGDEMNGFVLKGAGSDFALFIKQDKEYTLYIDKGKSVAKEVRTSKDSLATSQTEASKAEGEIIDAGDHTIVDKALVTHYAANLKEVMKNIGIVELREGKALKGFRVTFIRKGSHFAKLGLRRGDVIKSVNGEAITSYSAAMNVYKNINSMNSLSLTITRGEKEMELEYEVN